MEIGENGLIEVESVATGFMRIRKSAIVKIWEDCSEVYQELHHQTPSKMIFRVQILGGSLFSEDVSFCTEWRYNGGKIYIDPKINCGHEGSKRWVGNFYQWMKMVNN